MGKNSRNGPQKKSAIVSSGKTRNRNKAADDFGDEELLAFALPWLSHPKSTTVRSAKDQSGTTVVYQSKPPLDSGHIETRPQSEADEIDVGNGNGNKDVTDEITKVDENFIKGKLARRAYHLPNNNYCQDYKQYLLNCHLLFGLFCYDKRSPVRMKHRLLILCGSLAFGLNITNIIYLWGNQVDEEITDAFTDWARTNIYNGTNVTNAIIEDTIGDASDRLKVDIGSQLTILWTVGSAIHAAFDMALWHMISCGYCSYGTNASNRQDCLIFGWSTAISIVMLMIIATCVVVYFRVFPLTDESDRLDEQLVSIMDDEIEPAVVMGFFLQGDFSFILAFIIEFLASLFIWTPFLMTTLFTGVLGCGRIPCIGGRPREVWKERNGKDGRQNTV